MTSRWAPSAVSSPAGSWSPGRATSADAAGPERARSIAPVSLHVAVATRSFRRYSTYTAATLAGIFTNSVFGVIYSYAYLALWAQSPDAGGYDTVDAVTYVWIGQALLMTVALWGGGAHRRPRRPDQVRGHRHRPLPAGRAAGLVPRSRPRPGGVPPAHAGTRPDADRCALFDLTWPAGRRGVGGVRGERRARGGGQLRDPVPVRVLGVLAARLPRGPAGQRGAGGLLQRPGAAAGAVPESRCRRSRCCCRGRRTSRPRPTSGSAPTRAGASSARSRCRRSGRWCCSAAARSCCARPPARWCSRVAETAWTHAVTDYRHIAAMWVRSSLAYPLVVLDPGRRRRGHQRAGLRGDLDHVRQSIDSLGGFTLTEIGLLYGATGLGIGIADLLVGSVERIGARVRLGDAGRDDDPAGAAAGAGVRGPVRDPADLPHPAGARRVRLGRLVRGLDAGASAGRGRDGGRRRRDLPRPVRRPSRASSSGRPTPASSPTRSPTAATRSRSIRSPSSPASWSRG